jgi:hypothetical protein
VAKLGIGQKIGSADVNTIWMGAFQLNASAFQLDYTKQRDFFDHKSMLWMQAQTTFKHILSVLATLLV